MSRKRGGFALILLGVVLAVGVAMLVFNQAQRAAETARMESVDVLVAAQDIPERSVMVAPFVSVKRMLPASLPPGAMDRPEQVLGKMTVGPILAGDFILPGKLVDSDGRSGLAYVVPKGKVVITMPASDILSTGAIHPGDVVDLLVTINPDKEKERATGPASAQAAQPAATPLAQPSPTATPVADDDLHVGTTQTTMQNLKVLAIGSVQPAQAAPPGTPDKTRDTADRIAPTQGLITFAVDRQDALVLKALKDNERVKMEMVLRAAGDDKTVQTDPVTLKTIVERYQFRPVATPAATTTPVAKR
jgi:Flp pilus assembly protein CpaB